MDPGAGHTGVFTSGKLTQMYTVGAFLCVCCTSIKCFEIIKNGEENTEGLSSATELPSNSGFNKSELMDGSVSGNRTFNPVFCRTYLIALIFPGSISSLKLSMDEKKILGQPRGMGDTGKPHWRRAVAFQP